MDLFLLSLSDPAHKSAPAPPLPPSDYPLHILLDWQSARSTRQLAKVAAGSVLVHAILFTLALQIPSFVQPNSAKYLVVEHKTPLYFPRELTQKAPNRNKVTKQIDLASLIASQRDQQQQQASPNPTVRHFEPPQNLGAQANKTPRIMPDAPVLAANQNPGDATAGTLNGLSAPPPPPNANPSQFQTAGSQSAPKTLQPKTPPPPGVLRPGASNENQTLPAPALPGLNGQLGNIRPSIELLSDPHGADFRHYLEQVLTIVRANTNRSLPEAVTQHKVRGRTKVQFIINRDGSITRVVIAEPSGVMQLDLYSNNSLMRSNPLPPLPAEFTGSQVTLAFTFDYNMPNQ